MRRFILPVLLIVCGIILLIGCIPIPATHQLQVDGRSRPETAVGTDDKHPVRLGETRIEDAFIEISKRIVASAGSKNTRFSLRTMALFHWRVSEDRMQFAAEYSIRTATWFYPLCFYAAPSTARRWVVLTIDRDGIVQSVATTNSQPPFDRLWPARVQKVFDENARRKIQAAGFLPSDEVIQYMIDASDRTHAVTHPTTRPPATQ